MSKPFDFSTIQDFDGHIGSSIMGYALLDDLITSISGFFIGKESTVVDLGCTSGRMVFRLSEHFGPSVKVVGLDIDSTHFPADCPVNVSLETADITSESFAMPNASLVLSVFTLQFISPLLRPAVITKIYNSLPVGGAFIFCEKEYTLYSKSQEVFTFSNYNNKRQAFSEKEILDKEVALRSVMHPNDSRGNKSLLDAVAWTSVDPFFQSLNFKGYLCIK